MIASRLRANADCYLVAMLAVLLTLALRLSLGPWLGRQMPFLMFFMAILATSCLKGFRAGLLATMLSALAVDYFFIEPLDSFSIGCTGDSFQLWLFVIFGCGMAYFAEILLTSRSESERQARLLDQSQDAIFAFELHGPIVYWNRGAEQLYGIGSRQALGSLPHDLLATEFPESHEATRSALVARGEWLGELTHITAGGDRLIVECRMALIEEPDGRRLVLESSRDITSRKDAESRLMAAEVEREQEIVRQKLLADSLGHLLISEPEKMVAGLFERLSATLGLSGYFNYMVDEPGESLLLDSYAGIPDQIAREVEHLPFNQAVCGVVASSRRPIAAMDIQNSDDPKVQLVKHLGFQAYFCNPLLAGDRLLGTLSFARSDRDHFTEHELDFLTTISHYVALAKERQRLLSVTRQRTTLLEESEERFRQLADNIVEGFWMQDVATNRRIYASPAFERLFGWSTDPSRSFRNDVFDAVHPDDRERVERAFREKALHGLYDEEYRVVQLDGAVRWVRDRGFVIKAADGTAKRLVGLASDITEQKQAEEELRQAKEAAEVATRAKDHFLAVLSHELRTPLTPILMAVTSRLKNSQCSATLPRTTLAMIRDNILLEVRLIEDLLDISRLGQGRMTYHFETVNLHALVERCVDTLKQEFNDKKKQLTIELRAVEHHVQGDSVRLQQVVWNLLKNAMNYTAEGGRISIRTRSDRCGAVTLVVEDDGMGIDPVLLPRIFEAFERGDAAAVHHISGLGLGLPLSRAIVQAHCGTLEADSAGPGQGSSFTLTLGTVPRPHDHRGAETSFEAVASRPLQILIAEDNAATAQVFALILEDKGHVVTTANSLREAIGLVSRDLDFDLLISDIDLADGSGLDLMRLVRAQGDTPGIALSGYATRDDIRESEAAGFSVHLAKPVTVDMLESAIHKAVCGDGMARNALYAASGMSALGSRNAFG